MRGRPPVAPARDADADDRIAARGARAGERVRRPLVAVGSAGRSPAGAGPRSLSGPGSLTSASHPTALSSQPPVGTLTALTGGGGAEKRVRCGGISAPGPIRI